MSNIVAPDDNVVPRPIGRMALDILRAADDDALEQLALYATSLEARGVVLNRIIDTLRSERADLLLTVARRDERVSQLIAENRELRQSQLLQKSVKAIPVRRTSPQSEEMFVQ